MFAYLLWGPALGVPTYLSGQIYSVYTVAISNINAKTLLTRILSNASYSVTWSLSDVTVSMY